jgi:WD40 repeat protein
MAFDAFISYSHAADGQLAPALQRAIQRLAKPWYRARALRVFRDESALSANPHLWSSIQRALDESEWFVLLASPDAVTSEWVNRELDYWLSTESPDQILVVVTDGTWEWDAHAQALTGTAVPPALRDAFGDEPRHVDLRWARTETDLDMHHTQFRDAVAQLAAPMHGIAKDDLDSEDVRQHRHARRLARGGVTVLAILVVISLVTTAFAVFQRHDAVIQRNHATEQASVAAAQRLAALATTKLPTHGDLGLLLATEAFHRSDSVTTRAALFGALTAMPQLVEFLPGPRDGTVSVVSPDGRLAAEGTSDGSLRFWDLTRPSVSAVTAPPPNELRKRSAARPPGTGSDSPAIAVPDSSTMAVTAMSFDRNGDRLFALYGDGYLQVWDVVTHRPSARLFTLGASGSTSTAVGSDIERYVAPPDMAIAVSPDGRRFAVTGVEVTTVSEWDSHSGALIGTTPPLVPGATDPRVFRGVAYAEDGRTLYVWGSCNPTITSFSLGGSTPACPSRWQGLLSLASPLNRPLPQFLPVVHTSAAQVQVPRIAIAEDRSGRHLLLAGGRTAQHPTLSQLDNMQILTQFETGAYNDVAMSHDGSVVALADSDGTITIWSPSAQHQLEPPLLGQGGEGRSVSLSDDGQILASTAFDGSTAIWDLSGAGALALGPEVASAARGVPVGNVYTVGALDGDGSRLAVASANKYETWKVADTAAGFARIAGTRPLPNPSALAESDPSVLAYEGDQVVLKLAPATRSDRVHLVAGINPSGDVSIVDTRTAQTIGKIPASNHVATALAISALGDELAVGRADGTMERYALPSLQRVGVVFGSHTSPIKQIAYQPSGQLIASGSPSAVDLIDRSLGEIVATIGYATARTIVDSVLGNAAPSLGNGAVQFDATGRHFLTSGFESSRPALMWSTVPAEWARAACRAARRNLTRTEWTQFLGSGVPYERTCPQWPAGP